LVQPVRIPAATEATIGPPGAAGFSQVRDYLRRLPQPIRYHPNPGNGGDALIAAASWRLFDELSLEVHPWREGDDARGAVLVYGGGGNLVPLYRTAKSFVGRHHRAAARLVVLPQSIDGNDRLLAALGANVDLLCREHTSFERTRRLAPRANVLLVEDLSLSLDARALLAAPAPAFAPAPGREALERSARRLRRRRGWLSALAAARAGVDGERVLRCFRRDRERLRRRLPFGNIDLSLAVPFELAMAQRANVERTAWEMLAFLDRFDRIETDRLHVCIGAALLGKRVDFFPNSYWKNRAVFEASLAPRFERVRWRG
jgi:hypothetical protein